ncbi:MAG: DUF4912 domain-containing protein [Elusimicrobiaceae bacterium]|jgi:uncharacterized protein|nr:DUF4912 domain-containing protein [Elusimicrobiaceae bacterium]MBT3954970.1 DUF4912 domain-containing protein [Elusimicrobiaceae bacterium]MBT4008138.1 DUF4912 domain-containing protein [Elusimicrobiaceae bacterium]MBT4402666.1 DUF4912 domain-containing protein [Elusimicrobiaceae bacterium]MBT4440050.1 DUF4912 domain-containing protein [Elusimicrobiaceae bacterium]
MENFSSIAFIKREDIPSADGHNVPYTYGETEAYQIARDPRWLFLYWDITEDTYKHIKQNHGQDVLHKSKNVIRLYDITGIESFDGLNANYFHDIPVLFEAKSWYIQVPYMGKKYACDIGLLTDEGKFILIARAKTKANLMPFGEVSNVIDEKWMIVEEDFKKLYKMASKTTFGSSEVFVLEKDNLKFNFGVSLSSSELIKKGN